MAFGLNFVILSMEFLRAGQEYGNDSKTRICDTRDIEGEQGKRNE
jgi:hypothetical protein